MPIYTQTHHIETRNNPRNPDLLSTSLSSRQNCARACAVQCAFRSPTVERALVARRARRFYLDYPLFFLRDLFANGVPVCPVPTPIRFFCRVWSVVHYISTQRARGDGKHGVAAYVFKKQFYKTRSACVVHGNLYPGNYTAVFNEEMGRRDETDSISQWLTLPLSRTSACPWFLSERHSENRSRITPLFGYSHTQTRNIGYTKLLRTQCGPPLIFLPKSASCTAAPRPKDLMSMLLRVCIVLSSLLSPSSGFLAPVSLHRSAQHLRKVTHIRQNPVLPHLGTREGAGGRAAVCVAYDIDVGTAGFFCCNS